MTTTLYSVTSDDFEDGEETFTSKAAAVAAARACDTPAVVDKMTLAALPRRELLCACVNRRGYVAETQRVFTNKEFRE